MAQSTVVPGRTALALLLSGWFATVVIPAVEGQGQNGMGQYAALPWSLLWLNPSYTGFYGGLGNVGQLTPDSAYLFGAGGQIGVGGVRGSSQYNYGLGAYNKAPSTSRPVSCVLHLTWLLSTVFLLTRVLM